MRILYVDVDSLRPDHLGCYGYARPTSPRIDAVAATGVRFENYYVTDAPCLPSRTALFTGRFGIHTGVINHGGLEADIRPQGAARGFANGGPYRTWVTELRRRGHHTCLISPFPTRHAAWQVVDGFREWHDTGRNGLDLAHEVAPVALRWLAEHASEDNWFLHVNLWDPHTPYRTPLAYGNPYEGDPGPAWLTEEIIARQRASHGPHSARDVAGWGPEDPARWPRVPAEIATRRDFKQWVDGYDVGVRYADDHIGQILDMLARQGVLSDTVVIISGDHGENLGELNVYGDHQTADQCTSRVPLIIAGPGVPGGRVDEGLHYQIDLGPTLTEWAGGRAAPRWDGQSFLSAVTGGPSGGRPFLVLSQGAWSCQRAVRFEQWLLIRTYHDGLKDFPDLMLFDVARDPHETCDLAAQRPDVVGAGLRLLDQWYAEAMGSADLPADPMWHVIAEGGPFHTAGQLERYLTRLRETGRSEAADRLEARHARARQR
jgi:arylsulfatase A-like enzyme